MPAATLAMPTEVASHATTTTAGTIGQYHAGKIVELREVRKEEKEKE